MNIKTENNKIPEEAIKLLPWYATGWLSPEERDYVKQVLIDHPELHDLLISEREMIRQIKESPDLLDLFTFEPVDKRLSNVLERIDSIDIQREQADSGSKNNSFISRMGQRVLSILSESTRKQQYAAFAVITTVSVALLFAFVSPLLLEQTSTFHPSSAEVSKTKSSNKTVLLVGLNTDHKNPKLLQILKEAHATMNAVPGKDGMYRVSLSEKLNPEQTKQLLKKLTSYKDIFWFAGEAY